MDLKGKRILVTGSDGFIGSHLVEELVRRGHRVRAFVFYNSFNSWGWLDESEPEVRKSIEVVAGVSGAGWFPPWDREHRGMVHPARKPGPV